MRIKCYSVDDFLTNLLGEEVYRKIIHVNCSVRSLTDWPVRTSPSIGITIQASAVLEYDDGAEALLECGEDCGVDYRTADGHTEGSEKAEELRDTIEFFCLEHNLMVKPGVLDI